MSDEKDRKGDGRIVIEFGGQEWALTPAEARHLRAQISAKLKPVPRRLCADCREQITRHHKWWIGDDLRLRHRSCAEPDEYGDRAP